MFSDLLIPGSDFLIAGLARLVLLLGVVGLFLTGIMRLVTRRARRGAGRRGAGERPWTGTDSPDSITPSRRRVSIPLTTFGVVTIIGVLATGLTWRPSFDPPQFPELPEHLLPANTLFYRPVTDLPVAPDSERWIGALGSEPLVAPFGGKPYLGNVAGMPFNMVDKSTRLVDVALTQYPEISFPGPYPLASPPLIEGLPNYGNDQHYLAIDPESRTAWELIALRRWFTRWEAGAGGTWSMDSVDYPDGWTIVAQLPLLPGVVRYEEVAAGRINHMILGMFEISARGRHVWPARSTDGQSNDPDAPPMGAWMRLRSDVDLSGLGPQAKVVAQAAQTYGILISDTGPGFRMRGTADSRWDRDDLRTLETLTTDDFEFVDVSSIIIDEDTLAVNQPAS